MAGNRRTFYVADASVLVKWVVGEKNGRENAISFRSAFLEEKIEVAVPDFCYYEVMNVMTKKMPEFSLRFLSFLLNLGISECRLTLGLSLKALDIVRGLGAVSFYDAVYHALAMKLGGTFLTADEKYYQKAKSLNHIQLLRNYRSI